MSNTDFFKNVHSGKLIISKFLTIEEQVLLNKIKSKLFIPENCERKRVIVNYNDDYIDVEKYISIVKINYNKKFGEINHRDVLGAMMALGIKRECIGDIIVSDEIYVFIIKEMENFIINNLFTIGKMNVDIQLSSFKEIENIEVDNYIEDTYIVSSYRLDAIISERCSLSREKAKQFILLKNVKINGVVNTNPDYILKIDDLVSIHRFGRLIIKEEVNKTKKEKYVLKILRTK